jgi:AhpD family alkylhydroperoxidase
MLLAKVQQDGGDVPPLLCLLAHAPAALAGYIALRAALQRGTLSVTLQERIAVAVAASNGCDERLARHTALGRAAGLCADELEQAARAQATDARAAVVLRFADALIETRGRVDDGVLADLWNAGYSDAAIIEIVAVVATNLFANHVNNLARSVP